MNPITLDTATHTYYHPDSRIIPSVSQILSFSGRTSKFYKGTAARENGTEVHGMTQAYDANEYAAIDWLHVDPYFITQYLDFLGDKDAAPKWEGIEEIIFNPALFYAGTIDRRGWLYGRRSILDLKTGSTVPGSTGLQTALYAMGAYPDCYQEIDRYVLHINPKLKRWKIRQYSDLSDFTESIRICEEFHREPNQ